MFTMTCDAKISRLNHELHSIQKRNMTVSEYLVKIKKMCDLLAAFKHPIFEGKQIQVILAGLSADFEAMVTIAFIFLVSLQMDQLVECESRQH